MAKGKKTGGRQPGTPNKVTRAIREHFEHAFELLQQDDTANLTSWARANPTEFYRLSSKLIPTQVNAQGSITLEVITGVPQAGEDLV